MIPRGFKQYAFRWKWPLGLECHEHVYNGDTERPEESKKDRHKGHTDDHFNDLSATLQDLPCFS